MTSVFMTAPDTPAIAISEQQHRKTNEMICAPSEDSARASTQSDQSIRCPHEETLGP